MTLEQLQLGMQPTVPLPRSPEETGGAMPSYPDLLDPFPQLRPPNDVDKAIKNKVALPCHVHLRLHA